MASMKMMKLLKEKEIASILRCDDFADLLTQLMEIGEFEYNGDVADAAYKQGLMSADKVEPVTRSLHNWRNKRKSPHLTRSKDHLAAIKIILVPTQIPKIDEHWDRLLLEKQTGLGETSKHEEKADAVDEMMDARISMMETAIASMEGVTKTNEQFTTSLASGFTKAKWYAIGLSVALLVLVIAITLGSGILPLTDTERAAAELQRRGITLTSDAIGSMFATGDMELIDLATKAGMTDTQIKGALKTTALDFFKATKNNPDFKSWFDKALTTTIDPQQRVTARDIEMGLLNASFEAGNATAMLSLLDAGASPHSYQDLYNTKKREPFFLFPIHNVARSKEFTTEEKKTIIARMLKHNVSFIRSTPSVQLYSWKPERLEKEWLKRVYEELDKNLGSLTNTKRKPARLDAAYERDTSRCKTASARSDIDWCAVVDDVPAVINATLDSHHLYYFGIMFIQDLINISESSAYFQFTHLLGKGARFGILEVTRDSNKYIIRSFLRHASLSLRSKCRTEKYSGCFAELTLERKSPTKMIAAEHYELEVFPTVTADHVHPFANTKFDFYVPPQTGKPD